MRYISPSNTSKLPPKFLFSNYFPHWTYIASFYATTVPHLAANGAGCFIFMIKFAKTVNYDNEYKPPLIP